MTLEQARDVGTQAQEESLDLAAVLALHIVLCGAEQVLGGDARVRYPLLVADHPHKHVRHTVLWLKTVRHA